MRFTGLRRLWVAVALVPLLSSLAFASGTVTFVCEGDEGDLMPRAACCCPEGGSHAGTVSVGEPASISPACCCRLSRMEASTTPAAATPRPAAQVDAKILVAPIRLLALDPLVSMARASAALRLAQPPPPSVPILLAKQSFLA